MNVTLFFHVWAATHILKLSSGTVPLNFVWLSRNVLSFFLKLQTSLFPFLLYITLMLCGLLQLIASFSERNWSTFLCDNVTQISWVSLLSLCECHMCASPFSLCECKINIRVSPLLLSGHSTFFFFWVITDSFSFLSCVDYHTSFLNWTLNLSYLFSQFW